MPLEPCHENGLEHTSNQLVLEAQRSRRGRKAIASAKRIEEIIAAGQRRGLSVSKVVQLPDGTSEVHFGAANTTIKHNPLEWDI